MDQTPSAQRTIRTPSNPRGSALLIIVLLAGIAGIAFIWLMIQPRHIVSGKIQIAPVVRSILTGEPQPDETANYAQFVNTQAVLLMNDEQRLQKVADDLSGRNLAFFSGAPASRIDKLLAKILPGDPNALPDEILREAIAEGDIWAAYIPNTELMDVTMKCLDIEEARTIVNSFLRNYVGQYGVEATTSESQKITILENQRNEIQKRILEARAKIRDLAMESGTTALDPRREMEMRTQAALQAELTQLESQKIKIEADIDVYEKAEILDMAPEQVAQARTTHVNSDPMIKELTTRIVQVELDQIVAGQTQPAAETRQGAVLKALQQKLEERLQTLAQEFDRGLESSLRDAARRRMIQAKAEKARIEAHIDGIHHVLDDQEVKTVTVGRANLDIQDLQRRLTMDEEVLDQVNRRLRCFEMERDRRPRVQIASLAEVKNVVNPRWQWTFVAILVTVALSLVLWIIRRRVGLLPKTNES
jgi:hypothetical protein